MMYGAPRDLSNKLLDYDHTVVEIALEPDVLSALYRRGRRRLRDIQASSQASLKLDRVRGVLRATGSRDAIADVQRQLECVSGSHLDVSAAVWAELMRTRTDPDMTHAAVARIQHESGCRIHIERNSQQVQLFGPKENSAVSQWLLEKLESMCTEEVVEVKCALDLDLQKLDLFAQEFGVTLQIEESLITILGIEGAVLEAANALRTYDEQKLDSTINQGRPSSAALLAINTAMSKLTTDSDKGPYSPLFQSNNLVQAQAAPMAGAVTFKRSDAPAKGLKSTFEACPTCGGGGNFCVRCGEPTEKMPQCPLACCPTCGVVGFCAYCGHPTGNTTKPKMSDMGNGQLKLPKDAGSAFDPGMFRSDQIQPTSPMQFVQLGMANPGMSQMISPVAMYIPFAEGQQQGQQLIVDMASNNKMAGQFGQWDAGRVVPMAYATYE